jgi:hypothetical protein
MLNESRGLDHRSIELSGPCGRRPAYTLENHWAPYVRGEITRGQAIERLVAAITAR